MLLFGNMLDDTTTSEVIEKGHHSEAQGNLNVIVNWSIRNRVKLNTDKCEELRISFTSDCVLYPQERSASSQFNMLNF